ncbi:NUDIX hydrolase [Embleya sp. NBC_00896]|uniref:NUDIX hydrolase n=1 Tax=Embleya sp. NBC_00896 TaxID=2975961 RepID=UPI002F90E5AF|nr:NUDIX hydrolase [Embleya sp. NBC_00896]
MIIEAIDAAPRSPRVVVQALLFAGNGDVLLVEPVDRPGWEVPGGYLRAGESPAEACVRAVREELGLDPRVGDLLVVDWVPGEEWDTLVYVFDAGTHPGFDDESEVLPLDPSRHVDWTLTSAAHLHWRLDGEVLDRTRLALTAGTPLGHTLYLERGAPR